MSSVSSDSSVNHPRVRRKPAPSLDLEARYPTPDPGDPFAPLSVLRSRTASNLSNAGVPLSFRGESTSHLPSLPYTGGKYPPDIYQTCPDLDPPPDTIPTSDRDLGFMTTPFIRSTPDILDVPTNVGEPTWLPRDYASQYSRAVPIQRRRSRSAVSRKEARLTVPIPPKNSPYGHSKLQSYVLANVLSSTPALTAEPLPISPTSSIGQSNESVHSFFSRIQSDTGCPAPSSPLRLASFSADDHVVVPSKAKKFARLLPKKIGSRLSLTHQSTDNLALSQTNTSYTSFPHLPTERPSSKPKQVSEENTFHARRKSTTLFPAEMATRLHTMDVSDPVCDSTTGYICEPLTDAELGFTGGCGVSSPPSQTSHAPYSAPLAVTASAHFRSLTVDGRGLGPAGGAQCKYEDARPSTTQTPTPPPFDEHALPTPKQLAEAASCVVIAENGLRIPFGDLFRDQKTIVLFIRHFWCPLCQDYMFSVADNLGSKTLKDANLVVIGNGSYNMIKSYRQIFRTPFTFYTDPTLRLHKALGMTLRTMEPKSQRKRGGYVRHGPMGGIAMVFKNALRVGMPVWEKAGDMTQLGGEFVLGPGMSATFAHRMPNPRSHAPIMRVIAAAGIDLQCEKLVPTAETTARTMAPVLDEEQWMEERRTSLARIRERKLARRMGVAFPTADAPEEHRVVLPRIEPPGKLTRSDSIEEEEEEKEKENGEALQTTPMGDLVVVVKTDSTTCLPGHESMRTTSTTTTEEGEGEGEGETETSTVGSRTLSDSGSDRTRAEEVEPLTALREKVSMLDLEDPSAPEVVSFA